MPPRRAVPSGRRQPSNRGAIGAAAPFDGNDTNDITSWMFWNENWREVDVPDLITQLMDFTIIGHLSWVVFPPHGFRL